MLPTAIIIVEHQDNHHACVAPVRRDRQDEQEQNQQDLPGRAEARAPADADRQNAQKNGIDDIGAHQLDGGQIAAEVEVQKGKPADQRENSQAEQIPVEVSGVVTALHGGKRTWWGR